MSEQSVKRQKTTAAASVGVCAVENLPPELLDTICGFLDVGALCTARLVCTQFRDTASRFLHSAELPIKTLRRRPETTLNSFPNLSQVRIVNVRDVDLPMLAQNPVADAVTHLRVDSYFFPVLRRTRNAASLPLLPLPNLTSLTVTCAYDHATPFPHTLRELTFERLVNERAANLVTGLTNLTCLRINIRWSRKPFEGVRSLTALQRLEICCHVSLIPYLVQLTLLTHLHFTNSQTWDPAPHSALASLTRLHLLVHLGLGRLFASAEHVFQASMGAFTGLRSLDLVFRQERSAFETVCMTPFSHLTALRLDSYSLDASFLPRFNLEGLQDLSLDHEVRLDRGAVVALRRATGLTHLQLSSTSVYSCAGTGELGIALSCMSRLRALALCTLDAFQGTSCCKAIGLLTELTRLSLGGRGLATNDGVQVCLGLRKLRVLSIIYMYPAPVPSERLTPETFFAIATLPELRTFDMNGNLGIRRGDFLDKVWAGLNAERHDKGWPPLKLKIESKVSKDHDPSWWGLFGGVAERIDSLDELGASVGGS